jgi:Bacterial Ig-like domain (group 3)/MBG domain (YGX type)
VRCTKTLAPHQGIYLGKFLYCLALLILLAGRPLAFGQSVRTVEVYGPAPATQAYNGLGTNITATNAWEYADAQAAHVTWGRFDCSWGQVEIQNLPANTSGGYALPSACAQGLANSKTYGVHPVVDAVYGPPYSAIVTGTTTSAVPVGSTTVTISVTSGSLSAAVPGSTFLALSSGYLSAKYSYPGVLITSVSGSTLTLASAATTALAQGVPVTLNLVLYPPVIVAPGTTYTNNSSVQAFGKYASYLAQQIANTGVSGRVSVWNEPPWCCDKWDHGVNLYDVPPANSDISTNLGVELPLYISTMKAIPGAQFDSGYSETELWPGSLFYPSTFAYVQNLSSLQSQFASESFHIYGNNPEDYIWNAACVQANATPALLSNIVSGACTPIGLWTGATMSSAVASQSFPDNAGGISHTVTEAGICRSCTGATENQVTRFDLRLFLSMEALGVPQIMFYRMSGETDWEWVNASQTPYPVYTAFQGLMTDIGSIAQAPVTPCSSSCTMPTVSSYSGYYPLATASFVGAQAGGQANSFLYYTWQRTYGTKWTATPSPAAVPLAVTIPSGMTVASVKDMVTGAAVSFTFSAGTLTYPVADDPIEVLVTPVPPPTTKSPQTIIFPAIASRVYGSAPFAVTATSSLGAAYPVTIAVQSGPAVISGNMVTVTGVGAVVLQATQPGDTQYSAATATQSFEVIPAPLTVTAANATKVYGANNPLFTGTVTGAVAGDTFTESFSTAATATSNAGTYPIVPAASGTHLADYSVTTVNGTLTVIGAVTTTVLTAPASANFGSSVTLTATVTAAQGQATGTVTFYNGSTSLGSGTLNGSGTATLTTSALPAGTDTLTATYAAQGGFVASTSPPVTIIISAPIAASQMGFTVGANPTSLTIPPGQAAKTTLTITPTGGYSGVILVACLNVPANVACTFTQNQVALNGNNQSVQLGLTITASAQQAEGQGRKTQQAPFNPALLALAFWWPAGLGRLAALARRKAGKAQRVSKLTALLLCALAMFVGLAGCGANGVGANAEGTSQIVLVTTGTSQAAVITQSLTLTVQMTQ